MSIYRLNQTLRVSSLGPYEHRDAFVMFESCLEVKIFNNAFRQMTSELRHPLARKPGPRVAVESAIARCLLLYTMPSTTGRW